jgi:hypothetical protein
MKAMGVPMIQVWMLILSVIALSAHASDFNYIKLNPQFEQYLNQPKLKSFRPSTKSLVPDSRADEYAQKIRVSLLGANTGAGDFNNPFPTDGEESLLYQEIRTHLEASHREIGIREVSNLDFLNRQFNMGSENFSGFSWQKPYGVVHVWADRQVTPNLFGSNWLIQDTFTFDIEATTFLQHSNDAGITSMSDMEIGAFAGITFKRIYTYYHYANSYSEGLRADFSKLFLPFLKLNTTSISGMNHEEIIKREDNWTASAGGMIASPPYYGFSVAGGILAQFSYQNMVSVQNTNVQDATAEKIRLTAKAKKTTSVGVNISLQTEFLKILKVTIMNWDLSYEYASAKEFTLGMSAPEWQHVIQDNTKGPEIRSIIHGYGQVASLEPYVVELDESESSAIAQRGSLLIWGRLAKSKTEQVRVIKDDAVRVFYKSYAQNMRVVQNIFSRIFSAVIYKIFKLPMGTKNAAIYNRQVNVEYDATHPQSGDPNISRVESTEQFSFVMNQSYEAARTDRWIDKKFKNDLIWFVDSFTTLPKDYKAIIRSEQLKGPMLIESNLRVEKAGLDYLLASPINKIFTSIAQVCGSDKIADWTNEAVRYRLLKTTQMGAELCVKSIGNYFLEFKTDYQANSLKPSIAKFKSFITKYYKQSQALSDLTALFGEENTFIHGQIKATTSQNTQFTTSFSCGQFRGLGVIDNYKRSVGSRQPASIVNE